MLRHGSLFSGIGGFDIAATWMGWQNIFSCENNPFCQTILKHYWPQTQHYENIFTFNATKYRGQVDIISGGFPCQPFSQAGRRKGKADDRYLWPETRRVIMEARPKWIVLENVAGLFTILEPESLSEMEIKEIELFCKDGEQGANKTIISLQRRVIGSIISEIGSAGYVLPRLEDGSPIVLCIPACAVNAPHRRDRTWFVAYAEHGGYQQDHHRSKNAGSKGKGNKGWGKETEVDQGCTHRDGGNQRSDSNHYHDGQHGSNGKNEIYPDKDWQYAQYDPREIDLHVANASGKGLEGCSWGRRQEPAGSSEIPDWDGWPAQSPVCGRNDGLPRKLDGITFPKWKVESIKAYGNAIVPQVALEIFRSIEKVEEQSFRL